MDCDPDPQENAIFIPYVFTPNKDGNNDIFYIRGQNISSLDLIIYNRWGSQVYKSSELLHGWDGQYNGIDCPSGVYFFNAKVTFSDRQTETHHGSITLLR